MQVRRTRGRRVDSFHVTVSVPITIRCECGVATPATLGDRVTCACGREYDTADVPVGDAAPARILQSRMKIYARFGFIVVLAVAILGYIVTGWPGVALGAPAAAIFWWRVVQPRFQRRVQASVRALPTWQVQAKQAPSDSAP